MRNPLYLREKIIWQACFNLGIMFLATIALITIFVGGYQRLVYSTVILLPQLFTTMLPTATLGLSGGVVSVVHPVHALLCLISVFFNTVILYLAIEAEFLALVFLIVYVGAIAILFLFVIRLLNVKELVSVPRRKLGQRDRNLIFLAGPLAALFALLTPVLIGNSLIENDLTTRGVSYSAIASLEQYVSWGFQDILSLSQLLYTYYGYLFGLTILLLLTARLGAIILATRGVLTGASTRARFGRMLYRVPFTNLEIKNIIEKGLSHDNVTKYGHSRVKQVSRLQEKNWPKRAIIEHIELLQREITAMSQTKNFPSIEIKNHIIRVGKILEKCGNSPEARTLTQKELEQLAISLFERIKEHAHTNRSLRSKVGPVISETVNSINWVHVGQAVVVVGAVAAVLIWVINQGKTPAPKFTPPTQPTQPKSYKAEDIEGYVNKMQALTRKISRLEENPLNYGFVLKLRSRRSALAQEYSERYSSAEQEAFHDREYLRDREKIKQDRKDLGVSNGSDSPKSSSSSGGGGSSNSNSPGSSPSLKCMDGPTPKGNVEAAQGYDWTGFPCDSYGFGNIDPNGWIILLFLAVFWRVIVKPFVQFVTDMWHRRFK